MRRNKSRGRLFPKGGDDVAPPIVDTTPWPRSPPSGTTTQTPAIYVKVNSFLSMVDLNTNLNGMLPHAYHHGVYRCRHRQGPREKELPWCKEERRRRRKEEKKEEEEEAGGRGPAGPEAGQPGPRPARPVTGPVRPGPRTDPPRRQPGVVSTPTRWTFATFPVAARSLARFGPNRPVPGPVAARLTGFHGFDSTGTDPSRSTAYLFDPSRLVPLHKHLGHPLYSLDKI